MSNGTAAKSAPRPQGEGLFSRFKKFVHDSYVETRYKSAWPTATELKQFTLVVMFALLVVGVWISGIDYLLKIIFDFISGAR